MTREEVITETAKEYYNPKTGIPYSLQMRVGFINGAKWADENPNLYNDEKYHTVKVSQLDELNRKAELYDEVVDNLPKILEFLCETWEIEKDFSNVILDNLIQELQEKLEEKNHGKFKIK